MIAAVFRRLDNLGPQALTAATLSTLLVTFVLGAMLSGFAGRLTERTPFDLLDLQLAGVTQWFNGDVTPGHILKAWNDKNVLPYARRAQAIDVWFPPAYGALSVLLAVALWRCHPKYPTGGRWVWWIGIIAVAAVADEVENIFLWQMLEDPDSPAMFASYAASAFAIVKIGGFLVGFLTILLALRRARAWRGTVRPAPPLT